MQLDLSRQQMQGWAVLGGIAVVCLIAFYVVWDGGALEEQVQAAKETVVQGPQDLGEQVRRGQAANAELAKTIDALKSAVGFNTEKAFQVTDAEEFKRQLGYFFVTKRDTITQRLRNRARDIGINEFEEYLGFGVSQHRPPSKTPPEDYLALDLLRMLQLTEKAVSICLETPSPMQKILVIPHGDVRPISISAPGRPPVLQEYRLSLVIRGSLKDILWVIHRLSPGREATGDEYPLVLKALKITSDNRSPVDGIQFIDCELTVAGMHFLTDTERTELARPGVSLRKVNTAGGSSNKIEARTF